MVRPALGLSVRPPSRRSTLAAPSADRLADVTACPGADTCQLGITSSRGLATAIGEIFQNGHAPAADAAGIRIKISGCPNSCGQHHVGDIGLTGHSVKTEDGTERPFYSILVGGSVGEGRARVGRRSGLFREEEAPIAIAAVARTFESERSTGETFAAFVDRAGAPRLTELARGAVAARRTAGA